jgi:hypothetical protein
MRISVPESRRIIAESAAMTDWIDKWANGLRDDDKARHTKYQHELRRDELIQAKAPEFFAALGKAMVPLVEEMESKGGGAFNGIKCSLGDGRIAVITGNGKVSLSCGLHRTLRQFNADITVQGAFPGERPAVTHEFKFTTSVESGDVWATYADKVFRDPAVIAEGLLKEAFTGRLEFT